MSSSEPVSNLNLERDIPTTCEDVEALRRARSVKVEDPFGVVQQLIDALPSQARRQSRKTSAGWPDFELP